MSDVPMWNVFAYMNGDEDGQMDEHRRQVPEWRIEDVLRWCRSRGFDHIYLNRDAELATFARVPAFDGVVHHEPK